MGAPIVLCVAEKPSISTSIAAALAPNGYSTRRSFQDVHEFFAPFRGQQACGCLEKSLFLRMYRRCVFSRDRNVQLAVLLEPPRRWAAAYLMIVLAAAVLSSTEGL